jgi:hypothetical protein
VKSSKVRDRGKQRDRGGKKFEEKTEGKRRRGFEDGREEECIEVQVVKDFTE